MTELESERNDEKIEIEQTNAVIVSDAERMEMTDWGIRIRAIIVGAMVGTFFGLAGFAFLTSFHQGMGEVLFLLVPITAGISVALLSRGFNSAVAAGLLATIACLALLIATGKEGALCAVLAFPIIATGLAIGIGIGVLVRRSLIDRTANRPATMGMILLAGPALVFGGDRIERPLLAHSHIEVVQTSVIVNASPERVWSNLLEVDNIRSSKPGLMYIGLPIPLRCTLEGRGVGAKRTCYFNSGYIQETIRAWNPPYRMSLSIDRTHMPGRHWLGFENAEYDLRPDGDSTVLTRTTSISSHLLPRWYWRPFERLGVESEHRYILEDVLVKAAH